MNDKIITLDHGSGGKLSNNLISEVFLKHFDNEILNVLHDGAILPSSNKRIAFSTDSYTVTPLFFPGGNIGNLAIHGTVNDLAMCGAKPEYLSASFIIEEGVSIDILDKIASSMAESAKQSKVQIVTGDTKVVGHGEADGMYINTTGIGFIRDDIFINARQAQPGDVIIINGPIGNHGISILAARESLQLEKTIFSDTAPLSEMVSQILDTTREIHVLRDPTRGGLATTLNEIAQSSNVEIEIEEESIPIDENVRDTCEILGFDPLYLANEGKLIVFVSPQYAEKVLRKMKRLKYGEQSRIIGKVISKGKNPVYLKTDIGGKRLIGMLSGEQLPRIC
ncbi:MAG: hydrogenase expression/formation protein HypE [Atribacterota bacterium]|jgi:hydrogenase expression/formation protein HypE|nr:hydrogenase expression/formation protein HypE [Atribacterota bacterium]MDD3031492.1 hydrogenase expression/formation protein HypE [Atribacterota bacterium]MDD3640844.1 hydrogenase expression/formation protein HypE [Atribacterota bacterium]MDD4288359.1 hydrogenase expression/formation protein HypE [Atribacterota bacterium]MDD4764680.1 hydrogenase expression/formation protein HypE [Atribacterota bacterium]